MEHIADSSLNESEKREELYRFIKTIDSLRAELKIYLTQGKNASYRLQEVLKNVN